MAKAGNKFAARSAVVRSTGWRRLLVVAAGTLIGSPAIADTMYHLQVYCRDSQNAVVIFSHLVRDSYAGTSIKCAGWCGGKMVPITSVVGGLPTQVATAINAKLAEHEANAAAGRGRSLAECGGGRDAGTGSGVDEPCTVEGSIIDVQNQVLGERIDVAGTPFALYYRSDRTAGGRETSIGGWTLDVHHVYDLKAKTLLTGDGLRRAVTATAAPTSGELRSPAVDGTAIHVFDAAGVHLRTLNPLTESVRYQFIKDSSRRLTRIQDAYGNGTRIERDAKGNPTGIVSADGHRTLLMTSPDGLLASVTNPAGETTRLSYRKDGRLAELTDPKGQKHRFAYSTEGHLSKDENPAGARWELARTQSAHGFRVAMSSALARKSTFEVERGADGERRINTGPGGSAIQVKKDAKGNEKLTAADGTVSVFEFQPDARWGAAAPSLRNLSVTTPAGLSMVIVATPPKAGSTSAQAPAARSFAEALTINDRTYRRSFDPNKLESTVTTPAGRQIITGLDAQERVTRRVVPGSPVVNFAYDKRGRLIEVSQGTGPEARTVSVSYDEAGRVARIVDPLKRATQFEHDRAGRLTKQTFADGRSISYSYDANGNATSITPPGRPAHQFEHTGGDRLRRYVAPPVASGRAQTQYAYNNDEQLTRVTRPDSRTVDIEYDKAGRISALAHPHGKILYLFDSGTDQLSSVTATGGGTVSWEYDGFLPTKQAWSGAVKGAVTRGYDKDFRLSSIAINDRKPIAYRYDADGFLIQAGALALERDPRTAAVTSTSLGQVTTTHSYDSFGQIRRFAARFKDQEIFVVEYQRDAAGRITRKTETVEGRPVTFAYGYDMAGRVSEVRSDGTLVAKYEYDPNGNRVGYRSVEKEVKGTYDAQDRLEIYGGATYRYTTNGELAAREGANAAVFDYDALGNLRSVSVPEGSRIDYLIDGANRRIGRKVDGKLAQGLLYANRLRPAAELDGENRVVSTFVYGVKANVPEYIDKADGLYRIVTDHRGSARLVIHAETGAIAQTLEYDEFGDVMRDSNPGFQPFGFAGGLYDPQTRLTRFGARDYDAATGRWTAKDPVRFAGAETNLYAYSYNDPINFADANGLKGTGELFSEEGWRWSEGGDAKGKIGDFDYKGSGYAQSPGSDGSVSFGGVADFDGRIGPGTLNIDFTGGGIFGPNGTEGTFSGRAEYNIPLGLGVDVRGEAFTSGNFSGDGKWGGGASVGFGRNRAACRVGVGVTGDFSGNTRVRTTVEIPFF